MNPRRQFILSGTALALALSLPLSASAAQPAQLGFVYVSPIGDAGWTFQHDQGRKEMEKALGDKVSSRYVESVAEGADAERVIREFAASGKPEAQFFARCNPRHATGDELVCLTRLEADNLRSFALRGFLQGLADGALET